MSLKKFYKNVKLNLKNGFLIDYGYASKDTQQVICLSGKTYVTVPIKNNNILKIIDESLSSFKKNLANSLKLSNFSHDFIFDYDFPKNIEGGIKNKILNFDLYLKQNNDFILNEEIIKDLLIPLLNDLNESFKINGIVISETKE